MEHGDKIAFVGDNEKMCIRDSQMNIAKWDDEFIRLWNTPCHTPAYSKE